MLAMPFYSAYNEHIGWIYMIQDNTVEAQSMNLTNDSIASYERLLNSVLSCISAVMQKPTGSMLGIHNNHYTEQLGNTADGHLEISKAFKEPFDPQGNSSGRGLGRLPWPLVLSSGSQSDTSGRLSRHASVCSGHH